jgi:hypothetical protein
MSTKSHAHTCGTLRKSSISTRGYVEIHIQRPFFDNKNSIWKILGLNIQMVETCSSASSIRGNRIKWGVLCKDVLFFDTLWLPNFLSCFYFFHTMLNYNTNKRYNYDTLYYFEKLILSNSTWIQKKFAIVYLNSYTFNVKYIKNTMLHSNVSFLDLYISALKVLGLTEFTFRMLTTLSLLLILSTQKLLNSYMKNHCLNNDNKQMSYKKQEIQYTTKLQGNMHYHINGWLSSTLESLQALITTISDKHAQHHARNM